MADILHAMQYDWQSVPQSVRDAYEDAILVAPTPDGITIKTLEGDMHAAHSDFLMRGVQGEFYPCKPDIFEATYDRVDA